MNRFKIFAVVGMITALCTNFAWAGNIDVVEVDADRNALIDVTLCGGGAINDSTVVSSDDTLFVFFSASESGSEDCVTTQVSIPVPPCSEYSQIVAGLCSEVIPVVAEDGISKDLLIDSLEVELDVNIEGCCQEKLDTCTDAFDACAVANGECLLTCDPASADYDSCVENCNSTYNCEEQFTCQADYETCMMADDDPVIVAPEITAECNPQTLNLKSKGKYVTCYLMSSEADGVTGIDEDTLQLHYASASLDAIFSTLEDDYLMVKFSRPMLQALVAATETQFPVNIDLSVSGEQNGEAFEATDSMRVIKPGKKKKKRNKKRKKSQKGKK